MTPEFIVGGIAKNGTSYLHSLIRNHPQIEMPPRDMDHSFFDNDVIYKRGFEWYETIFDHLNPSKTIGQISADCAFNPGSIGRIKEHLPDIKLIFIFRNPIDSIYSLYWHQLKMGREYLSFEKALKLSGEKVKKSYYHFKMYTYFDRYHFAKQVDNIKAHFDESQLLFLPFEVFIKDELKIINAVFRFLEVNEISDINEIKTKNINRNKAKVPKYKPVVWLSYQLQNLRFKRLGRYILNKNLIEKKPPKISQETRRQLEVTFSDDIKFHNELVGKYS